MSDAAVEAFISRYMPAYELFGQDIAAGDGTTKPRWASNHLVITLDRERTIVKADVTRSAMSDQTAETDEATDMPVDAAS